MIFTRLTALQQYFCSKNIIENKISKVRLWSSYILQGIVSLFLFLGAVTNLVKTETASTNAKELGCSESSLLPLAIVLLTGLICYVQSVIPFKH